jgi:hypothetical protein
VALKPILAMSIAELNPHPAFLKGVVLTSFDVEA